MLVDIKMPDLATTDDAVTLLRWWVEVGAQVKLGQPLLEIETDKATMDVEAIAAGTLRAVFATPGDRVAVGQVIAQIEDVASIAVSSPVAAPSLPAAIPPLPLASAVSAALAAPATPDLTARLSLFARNKVERDRLAQQAQQAQRSGPAKAAETKPLTEVIRLSAVQRETARRLQEAKQSIPHFYLTTSAHVDHLVAQRVAAPRKIAWEAYVVLAAARALTAFERMGWRYEGEFLSRNPDAVGVAVDVDDELFVVPVPSPLTLSAADISDLITERVERIQRGDATARRLSPTWLTITNLGAENIETFQAIINPPGAAILAMGRVMAAVTAVSAQQIAIQQRVSLSLSADHRVINGKYAARFLSKLVWELEHS
jgi:pyruvate dehydrogenase E2 component (dihydrolipoamide acetyltransferase)